MDTNSTREHPRKLYTLHAIFARNSPHWICIPYVQKICMYGSVLTILVSNPGMMALWKMAEKESTAILRAIGAEAHYVDYSCLVNFNKIKDSGF